VKYLLNYIKVINQLLVLSVLKIWKKLSRKLELNSGLWRPKPIRASQSFYHLSHKLVGRIRRLWATYYTTLYTTPTSQCISHHVMGRGRSVKKCSARRKCY